MNYNSHLRPKISLANSITKTFGIAIALTTLLSLFVAGQGLAQDKNEQLRWELKSGDQFDVSLMKTGNVETQVDTRVRKVEIESQLEFRWKILENNKTGTEIEQKLTKIVLKSSAPGDVSDQRLSYDSSNVVYKKGVSNTVAKQLKPLIGLTYQFTMSDRGEILSVKLTDEQKKLLETIPDSLPIKDLLTQKGQQSNLGAATWVCPQTMSEDRTWQTKRSLDSQLGAFDRVSRFTAGELQRGVVRIDFVTDVKHDPDSPLKMFEGGGEIEFDKVGGFVRSSESTTRIITESPYRDLMVKTTIEMTTELKLEQRN